MLLLKTSDTIFTGNFAYYVKKPIPILARQMNEDFSVETLEGTMRAKKGDYLVIGVRGERYPCAREIFEESYDIYEGEIDA